MAIYPKPSAAMVYDLINASNPDLPIAASAGTVKVGTLTVVTPTGGAIQNTKTTLSAVPNGGFVGRKDVTFRRLDLSSIFRGVTVQIDKYSSKVAGGSSGTVVFQFYELLSAMNEKYGFSFTTDDFNDVAITRGTTQDANGYWYRDVTVTCKVTSLAWVGSFTFRWKHAPQDISTMITVTDIPGRAFPGGNDFSGSHKQILNSVGWSFDFSDVVSTIPAYASDTNGTIATVTDTAYRYGSAAIDLINSTLGLSIAKDWMIGAAYHARVLINNAFAGYPETNTRYYNRLMVIDVKDTDATYVGRLYIHYNR